MSSCAALASQVTAAPKDYALAVECARAHLENNRSRAAVKYAKPVIEEGDRLSDCGTVLKAFLITAKALAAMKKLSKAVKTASKGLKTKGMGEGVNAARQELQELHAELKAQADAQPKKPKKKRTAAAAAAPTAAAAASASATMPPPLPPPAAKKGRGKPRAPDAVSASAAATAAAAPGDGPLCYIPVRRRANWNHKDTWEETAVTDWAADKLAECLGGLRCALPPLGAGAAAGAEGATAEGGVLVTTAVSEVRGFAQIVWFQGRTKFLYDFSFKLGWRAAFPAAAGEAGAGGEEGAAGGEAAAGGDAKPRVMKGFLLLSEVGQDCVQPDPDDDMYELEAPFRKRNFPEFALLRRALTSKAELKASLKEAAAEAHTLQPLVRAAIREFQAALQQLPEQGDGRVPFWGRSKFRVAVEEETDASGLTEAQREAQRQLAQQQASRSQLDDLRRRNPNLQVTY